MLRGARFWVAMSLVGATGAGCSALAGIEDLQLTGSPDGASEAGDVTTGSSSGSSASSSGADGSGSGSDVTVDSPADVGQGAIEASVCSAGQTRCSGNAVETCTGGAWGAPVSCDSGVCSSGACSGACSGQGVCTPGATRCSGSSLQTCDACGQWGSATSCGALMTCSGGACVTAPTDCPGTFKICDGFESGTTIGSQWNVSTGANTTIVVDGTNPHTGSNALHIHYAGGGTQYLQTYIEDGSSAVFPLDTLYVRAWFSISALTGQTLISVRSNAGGTGGVGELGFESSSGAIFDDVEDLPTGNGSAGSLTATMPVGTYTCLELGIDASYDAPYTSGVENVWQDVSNPASDVADLLLTPAQLQTLRGVILGLQFQAPAGAFDLYIDDIAVDTSYIPCDQ